jgi:NhaP-type Na+/H+ or K+/H+ antiporter
MQDIMPYYLVGVLALGIAAQWLAWRLRLPSILLLLAFGFGAAWLVSEFYGVDIRGQIDDELLFPIISLSVAVILFEGGLTLRLSELRAAGGVVLRLVTIGALVTWIFTALIAIWLLGFDPRIAALIGAILVVTGPTVIGPLLRHVRPARKIGSIVKWEGIVIDPIGAMLAVLVYEAVLAGESGGPIDAATSMLQTVVVGGAFAAAGAWLLVQLLKRYWIPDYLHNPVLLASVLVLFNASNHFQSESGLLTVTLLGVILANQQQVSIKHILEFKENLRVLLISALFIVLASQIEIGDITNLGWGGLGFLVAMILVVRPASIFLATIGSELNVRERVFLAALAPRGIVAAAVSSVFALEVAHHAHGGIADQARQLVPLTFLVIVGTVAVYGLTAAPLARWLGLADGKAQGILFAGADAWVRKLAELLQEEDFQVLLVDTNRQNIAKARLAGLPTACANILSEHAREEIELGGIGRVLAVTSNDEVNSLAALEFVETFGSQNAYQLPTEEETEGHRAAASLHLRARSLFAPAATHAQLSLRIAFGAVLKKTTLTEEFTYENFQAMYGENALVLFLIEESGELTVCTADNPPTPKSGQKLICLVDEPAEGG